MDIFVFLRTRIAGPRWAVSFFEGIVIFEKDHFMADKHTEKEALRQLPDPGNYEGNYIDIQVPRKNGMYEVVTFAKSKKNGKLVWMALPYAR